MKVQGESFCFFLPTRRPTCQRLSRTVTTTGRKISPPLEVYLDRHLKGGSQQRRQTSKSCRLSTNQWTSLLYLRPVSSAPASANLRFSHLAKLSYLGIASRHVPQSLAEDYTKGGLWSSTGWLQARCLPELPGLVSSVSGAPSKRRNTLPTRWFDLYQYFTKIIY